MRLIKARVQNYRSIIDSGWFDVEHTKTILVGPNEAGKTVLLKALQQINPPQGVPGFNPLRDYPRSKYNDISTGKAKPSEINIVEGQFALDEEDEEVLSEDFTGCIYARGRSLDNKVRHYLKGGPKIPTYANIKKDLNRLCTHIDPRVPQATEGKPSIPLPSTGLNEITKNWTDKNLIELENAKSLKTWLEGNLKYVDKANADEEQRYDRLLEATGASEKIGAALKVLEGRAPIFVLFNNYFRVRPLIHLDHLAQRIEKKLLDDDEYDYGNVCLLKLLGFTARELSNLGKVPEPALGDQKALQNYRDQLDKRSYQLNAASVQLTNEIQAVWAPDTSRDEASHIRIQADAQYLKVVVEDELGVEVEMDQRSEGFQWLISFFVVFFAEVKDKHKNSILLLDEPGLSLHGLKQREFRTTISRLAESNQALYTTHSPFLVGPDELDLVRVVEMTDRKVGTKVHTTITANDPAALLPLQEALGYDLAQSLFSQQRNLVLEGLTDYWYLEATAQLLRESSLEDMNEKIALIPAANAGKVVYYATILHAQKLKVAALLDSDSAGNQAAQQEVLVHTLGNKNILRTRDAYTGPVTKPEIEDLLRETLIKVAKADLNWDVTTAAAGRPTQPIVDVFNKEISQFSKYKLAKAYLRWTRSNKAADLATQERTQWESLIRAINNALK